MTPIGQHRVMVLLACIAINLGLIAINLAVLTFVLAKKL